MRIEIILPLAIALASVECSGAEPAASIKSKQQLAKAQKELEASRQRLAASLRQNIIDRLKDPDSAKFKDEDLRSSEDPPAVSLCGLINSRNSYGGYTGFGRFVSTSTGVTAFESDPGMDSIWQVWCSKPYTQ